MKIHRHKTEFITDFTWKNCICPEDCANPRKQRAHGGIVRHETCKCDAFKISEINGKFSNRGTWNEPEPLDDVISFRRVKP